MDTTPPRPRRPRVGVTATIARMREAGAAAGIVARAQERAAIGAPWQCA